MLQTEDADGYENVAELNQQEWQVHWKIQYKKTNHRVYR